MQRLPKRLITQALTATAADASYSTTDGVTRTTIASATASATTSTTRTVTAYITPSGGSPFIAWTGSVPGSQSVVMSGLIGQNLDAGDSLSIKEDAGADVHVAVGGYTVVP